LLGTYKDDLNVIWVDAHADCIKSDLSAYPKAYYKFDRFG